MIEFAPATAVTNVNLAAGNPGDGNIALIALGTQLQPANDGFGGVDPNGDIIAPAAQEVQITGGRALLASTNEIVNSEQILLQLGSPPGEILVTQGDAATSVVDFKIGSSADDSNTTDTDTLTILNSVAQLISTGAFAGFGAAGASFSDITSAQQSIVSIFNPAAVLTLLQAISFLDASAFESELSLFGIIGEGIAQSLDQCEDAEGCAPSVTEEELAGFIDVLSDRISRLEGMLSSGDIDAEDGRRLLAQYRQELQAFMDYQTQLREYLARQEADEFGDDFGDEFDDVFEAEEVLEPAVEEIVEEEPVEFEEAAEETFDEVIEDEIPADTFEDIEEAVESFDELPVEEPTPEEPVVPDTSDDPAFDTLDDEFEELEEEIDDSLFNKIMNPDHVNQLAGAVRVNRRGQVIWGGDIVLPTLYRRF